MGKCFAQSCVHNLFVSSILAYIKFCFIEDLCRIYTRFKPQTLVQDYHGIISSLDQLGIADRARKHQELLTKIHSNYHSGPAS